MLVVHGICHPGDHPLRNPFPDENDAAFLVTVGIPTDIEAKVHLFKVTVTRQPESQDSGIKKLECDQTDQRFAGPKIKRGPSRNPGLEKIGFEGARVLIPRVRVDGRDTLRSLINSFSDRTGVTATLDDDGAIVLTAAEGRNIDVVASDRDAALTGLSTMLQTASLTLTSDALIVIDSPVARLDKIGLRDTPTFGPARTG